MKYLFLLSLAILLSCNNTRDDNLPKNTSIVFADKKLYPETCKNLIIRTRDQFDTLIKYSKRFNNLKFVDLRYADYNIQQLFDSVPQVNSINLMDLNLKPQDQLFGKKFNSPYNISIRQIGGDFDCNFLNNFTNLVELYQNCNISESDSLLNSNTLFLNNKKLEILKLKQYAAKAIIETDDRIKILNSIVKRNFSNVIPNIIKYKLTDLKVLILNGIGLEKIPDSLFVVSQKLEFIDLKYNSDLCSIPTSIKNCTKLKVLNLYGTKIDKNLSEINKLKKKLPINCKLILYNEEDTLIEPGRF
jgi:hypothetical protein